jgi:ATPase subunit of ABC transporter with duplicated ATPase domains
MMMQKNPILILDEPTNHLDLEAVSALAEGLSIFPGTVFVVSHDRDLISQVATRILSFTKNGLISFNGTYDEYLEAHPQKELAKKGKW